MRIAQVYARILENIPPERRKKSFRLLQFLVYSERPLTLAEAVDVIAVRIDAGYFDKNDRLQWPEEITAFCSSLVLLAEILRTDIYKPSNWRISQ